MATTRQRLAAKKLSESIRKKKHRPMGKILLDAGYSESTSKKPALVTRSKSWGQLLKEMLPDHLLATRHHELLNSGHLRTYRFGKNVKEDDAKEIINAIPGSKFIRAWKQKEFGQWKLCVAYVAPDALTRRYVLEMAYKLKARFAPTQHEILFENMDEEQLVNFIISKMSSKK